MLNTLKARVMSLIVARAAREEGQALVEYGLILALIAVVCIGALTLLGENVEGLLNKLAGEI
jgi:pilus assembly protein Flp/PilA